jgi:3-deoxy-D-manno-octulosonic-acid transferase
MYFLYYLVVLFARFILIVIAPFNKKIKLFVDGRKSTFQKIQAAISLDDKVVWIHVASLGEFEQGRPLIEEIKDKHPAYKIVVSFFSPSGYEVRKNYKQADVVCYLPLDTERNAKKFIKLVHPEIAIFVKYEFWPNFIRELHIQQIETVLVSGIFRESQAFFKPVGSWMRKSIELFSFFFVQDENSKRLLNSINIDKVKVSGDTRFDRVFAIKSQDNKLEFMSNFKQGKSLFVAGSTWKEDEKFIVQYINNCQIDGVKFVLAPHNMKVEEIKNLKELIQKNTVLYSEKDSKNITNAEVLIVDTIGLLTKIYSYADVAYIGGGFATGLHNVLEPAAFGLPVIIGPQFDKFKEAVDLVQNKGCVVVHDDLEFKKTVDTLFLDSFYRREKGQIAGDYILNNIGATSMIMKYVSDKIGKR